MKKYSIIKEKNSKIITFNIGGSNVFNDQNKGFNHIDKIVDLSKEHVNLDYKFIFWIKKNYDNKFKENKKIFLKNYLESKKIAKVFSISDYTFVLSKIGHISLITAESLCVAVP